MAAVGLHAPEEGDNVGGATASTGQPGEAAEHGVAPETKMVDNCEDASELTRVAKQAKVTNLDDAPGDFDEADMLPPEG